MAKLICTDCARTYGLDEWVQRCNSCGEPLEVQLELPQGELGFPRGGGLLRRYERVLPPLLTERRYSLGEGGTPLVEARHLAHKLGLQEILIKDETQNPTGSFKDRGTVLALHRAVDLGLGRVGTVSTGNMAASVAAYAARMEIQCYVLVKSTIATEKMRRIAIHGANLIAVEGDYGELYYRSLEIGQSERIYFANSDDPYRVEGQKTLIYEIWQALQSKMPDCIVLPVSSGGNISAVLKGLDELGRLGVLSCKLQVIGVQAAGAAPIATAYQKGAKQITRWSEPSTMASAIANPLPPSGNRVLRSLRAYGRGSMVTVSDEEILSAHARLAQFEGLSAQPAAATPVAALLKLVGAGQLAPDERILCILTGDGLRGPSLSGRQHLEVPTVTLGELRGAIADRKRRLSALWPPTRCESFGLIPS